MRPGHTISLFSLSKAYGMASWRIGYMVIPEVLYEAVNKIQDTILICPPAVSQHAALAALEVGRSFAARPPPAARPRLATPIFDALSVADVPCDVPSPDGAFYYLVRVHSTPGFDDARRALDPRASCGDDSRLGVCRSVTRARSGSPTVRWTRSR